MPGRATVPHETAGRFRRQLAAAEPAGLQPGAKVRHQECLAADDLRMVGPLGPNGSGKKTVAGQLSAAAAKVKGKPLVPVALLQIYDKAVYADAEGLYSDVVSLAGGTNIYDGQLPKGQYYAQVSVEDVAKKNPGTIVYLYESDADKASTLAYLKATFPTVAAVRAGRLIALPATDFIDMRAVDGVTALAAALHPAAQAS